MGLVIYIKPGCPYCQQARDYYNSKGVGFTEYDAQNDRARRKEMFAHSGGDPTVPCIVEVLSESTELYDRGKKFGFYRTIESLAEYLLVAQDECRVEQYVKQLDGRWLLSDYRSPEDVVELSSIQCRLALKEVYDKLMLP